MKLNTYLNFGGNCADAFRFYEKNLGGKISSMMTFGEMPDQSNVSPEMKNAVLHASISIGGTNLMASDVPPDRFQPIRSVYLSLGLDSDEEPLALAKAVATAAGTGLPFAPSSAAM